jgi:hypothetical protein
VYIHVLGIVVGMVIQMPARPAVSMSHLNDATLTIGLVIARMGSRVMCKSITCAGVGESAERSRLMNHQSIAARDGCCNQMLAKLSRTTTQAVSQLD